MESTSSEVPSLGFYYLKILQAFLLLAVVAESSRNGGSLQQTMDIRSKMYKLAILLEFLPTLVRMAADLYELLPNLTTGGSILLATNPPCYTGSSNLGICDIHGHSAFIMDLPLWSPTTPNIQPRIGHLARCGKSVNPTVHDEETVQEPLEEAQEDTEKWRNKHSRYRTS